MGKLVLSFFSGFTIMVLELLGARMLAPYFGNSTYVWGSVIGMFMAALAVGYSLGGRIADRKRDERTLLYLLLAGIAFSLLAGAGYTHLLSGLRHLGDMEGSIVGSALLFLVPTTLLAMVSPYLIRLLFEEDKVGETAGRIFAVSTAGSILGTFATAFYLIPTLGIRATLFGTMSVYLIIVLFTLRAGWPALLSIPALLLYLVPARTEVKPGWTVVHEAESPYNFIQVLTDGHEYRLRLNKETSFHSVLALGGTGTKYYYDYMLLPPLTREMRSTLILGAGAGTNIRQLIAAFPSMRIDAVEIDPEVVRAGKLFFELPDHPNIRLIVDDARPFVRRAPRTYDLAILDAFNGGLHIPFHVMTLEYFQEIHTILNSEGMLVINVLSANQDANRDYTLVEPIANTVGQVFGHVYALDHGLNTLLFASDTPWAIPPLESAALSRQKVEYARFNLRSVETKPRLLLTDDRSNLDALTNQMRRGKQ